MFAIGDVGHTAEHNAITAQLANPTVPTAATAGLTGIGNAINASGKFPGKQVFNTTTNRPLWAVGAAAGAVWVDSTGATVHTPV